MLRSIFPDFPLPKLEFEFRTKWAHNAGPQLQSMQGAIICLNRGHLQRHPVDSSLPDKHTDTQGSSTENIWPADIDVGNAASGDKLKTLKDDVPETISRTITGYKVGFATAATLSPLHPLLFSGNQVHPVTRFNRQHLIKTSHEAPRS
jgi:hypothetical protein